MASNVFAKDPDAVLDYKFDWSDWLASGETISTATITEESGITVDSDSLTDTNTSVTVWLSGGTAGTMYDVACLITTSASRTDERTIKIRCLER
jgi:hypothetical protein